jgi:hypothetical protein
MAIDPTELAQEQEQRQRVDVVGAPTEFAKGPEREGVEVAGLGELFKIVGPQVLDVITKIDSSVSKPIVDTKKSKIGTKQFPVGVAPRVPTPQERGLVDQPGLYSEAATKRELAPQILSAEGVEKFKERGMQTFGIGEEAPTDVLKDAQSALNEQSQSAEDLAINVNEQAQRALQADKRGFKPETGVIDEAVADEVLLRTSQKEQNIKSLKDGGDFNFDYVDTEDDVKAMITAVGEVYSDETVARTRGKIPNNKTKQDAMIILADEIGFTDQLLSRRIGEGGLSADEFVAARELLVRSATRLEDLAKQIKNGAGADVRLKFRRQLAIHSGIQLQLKGAQTEAARALQSFQIPVSGELSAQQFGAEAKRLLADSGQDDVTDQLADRLLRVGKEGGMKAINDFANAGYYAKTKQMVHEAYLAGLLSSPATQFKNIFSNATFMLFQLPTEIFAGVFGEVVRAGRKQLGMRYPIAEDQIYIEDAMLRVKGWSDAWGDAMKAASIAWRTELPAGSSKLDIDQYQPGFKDAESMLGKSLDQLGKRVRIPFRLLLAADEFTKTISQRGELYTALNKRYQHTLRNGGSKQEALDEAGMLMLDTRAVAEELDVKAKFDTLQSDLGIFGKVMGKFQRTLLGRFIVPFVTAPTNALLRTMEYTPFSKSAIDLLGRNGPRAQQLAAGRLSLGMATTWKVSQYAMDGRITGGMPETQKEREALPPGWQPYSFVLKGEGWPEGVDDLYDVFGRPNGPLRYVSFSGYEPIGGILAITADTVQRANRTKDPELQKNYFHASVISTLEYYKELPMLQGVADVIAFLDGYDAAKLARSYAESATPIGLPNPLSSLQRMFQRLADPTKVKPREDFEYYTLEDVLQFEEQDGRRIYKYAKTDGSPNYNLVGTPKTEWYSPFISFYQEMDSLQSKDSFFRDERDRNAVVYDTLGEVVGDEDVSFASSPGAAIFSALTGIRIKDGDALQNYEKELIRLHDMTYQWPLTNPEKFNNITLSYGTQSDLIRLAKNKIKIKRSGFGELTFRQTLEAVTQSNTYKSLPDKNRVALLRNINKEFIDQGFRVLIEVPGNEDLKKAYQQVERLKKEGRR